MASARRIQVAVACLVALCGATLRLPAQAPAARGIGEFQDQADVGKIDRPGSAEYDAGRREYRVTGSGENVWGKADAFQFVWRKAAGDVALSAEIRFEGKGANAHRKGCLMVRQSLEADAPYADVAVHGDGLISLQYRPEKGDETKEVKSTITAPAAVRLERKGDAFTLTVTPQDKPAATAGQVTVKLSDPVYVGLAVCSHDPAVSETANFSNVKVHATAPKPR
jgi:TolB protein